MVTRRQKQRSFKASGKPDLLEVLHRRRKTVADVLAQNDVRTAKQLDDLLFSYLTEYDLSPKFISLAEELLSKLENEQNIPKEETTNTNEEVVMMDTIEVVEEKPRKRAKKSSEKLD
jgi:hypothetical protein